MKKTGIFKKENKTTKVSNIQKMDKNQMAQVLGGVDAETTPVKTATTANATTTSTGSNWWGICHG